MNKLSKSEKQKKGQKEGEGCGVKETSRANRAPCWKLTDYTLSSQPFIQAERVSRSHESGARAQLATLVH